MPGVSRLLQDASVPVGIMNLSFCMTGLRAHNDRKSCLYNHAPLVRVLHRVMGLLNTIMKLFEAGWYT